MGKNKIPGTLTKKHWFGYMFGDWGGCMTFALMASIFSMYCTNVLGIDPTLMGTLVLVWTIWDAINDPMMGALMDKAFAKRQNKNGKFRPWLLRSTPLLAVTAIALWTVPTFFDGIATVVCLFSCKILYEGAYRRIMSWEVELKNEYGGMIAGCLYLEDGTMVQVDLRHTDQPVTLLPPAETETA